MIAMRLFSLRVANAEIGGVVEALPDRLFNAENLCMIDVADAQRLFATGGETVAEIVKDHGGYRLTPITIEVDGAPEHCMTTRIAANGEFLYLACARIHRGNNPFVPGVLCDVNQVEQTGMGLMLTYLAAFACSVESYIVRATLRPGTVKFTDLVAKLPGKFLANGFAADETGTFLYVANSAPTLSAGIYRVPTQAAGDGAGATLWCRPRCMPNGIKVRDGAVYFTGNTPVMSAVLGKTRMIANGGAAEPEEIYRADFSMFDDFDLTDDGFVVAHFADYWRSDWLTRFGAGVLRFLAKDGSELGIVNRDEIEHPSAVAAVKNNGRLFDAGDIIVTDKARHRVTVFKPDHRWRASLLGGPTPAAIAAA